MRSNEKNVVERLLLEEKIFAGKPEKYRELYLLATSKFIHGSSDQFASESAYFQGVIELLNNNGYRIVEGAHEARVIPFKLFGK